MRSKTFVQPARQPHECRAEALLRSVQGSILTEVPIDVRIARKCGRRPIGSGYFSSSFRILSSNSSTGRRWNASCRERNRNRRVFQFRPKPTRDMQSRFEKLALSDVSGAMAVAPATLGPQTRDVNGSRRCADQ